MRFLTKTIAFAFLVAAAFAGCAAAATLALASSSLAAGNATVSSCGISSLTATRRVDNSGNVTRVDVANLPAACAGETIQITFVGAASVSLGSGSTSIGNCAVTCSAAVTSFSSTVSAPSVASYSFSVVGS